jgi:hypothetical protein
LGYQNKLDIETKASLQLLTDVYRGTLTTNVSFLGEKFRSKINSYQYPRFGQSLFHHFEIGDTHSFTSQLIDARNTHA